MAALEIARWQSQEERLEKKKYEAAAGPKEVAAKKRAEMRWLLNFLLRDGVLVVVVERGPKRHFFPNSAKALV
jgi:hypothetical protein